MSATQRDEWAAELVRDAHRENSPAYIASGDSVVLISVDEDGAVWLTDAVIRRHAIINRDGSDAFAVAEAES